MNSKDFFDLVAKMRGAQETYYSKRTTSNLIEARDLERMVDRELKKGLDLEPIVMDTSGEDLGIQITLDMEDNNEAHHD